MRRGGALSSRSPSAPSLLSPPLNKRTNRSLLPRDLLPFEVKPPPGQLQLPLRAGIQDPQQTAGRLFNGNEPGVVRHVCPDVPRVQKSCCDALRGEVAGQGNGDGVEGGLGRSVLYRFCKIIERKKKKDECLCLLSSFSLSFFLLSLLSSLFSLLSSLLFPLLFSLLLLFFLTGTRRSPRSRCRPCCLFRGGKESRRKKKSELLHLSSGKEKREKEVQKEEEEGLTFPSC